MLLQHFLPVQGGQFPAELGGQFRAESVVSLRRNQVVNISEFSTSVFIGTIFALSQFEGGPHPKSNTVHGTVKGVKSEKSRKTLVTTIKIIVIILFILYLSWEAYNFYLSLGRN